MSAALQLTRMTLEEFLDWERRQPVKYEFDGFQPVAMTGVSLAHGGIQSNLIGLLNNHLRGRPCRVFGSDVKLRMNERIRYPDAFVVCPPIPVEGDSITNPVIIFEILSPSTASRGLVDKNLEYRAIPSVRRYVILEQTSVAGLVFHRAEEDWVGHLLDREAMLDLPEIGLSLPLAALYEGVEFPPPPEEPAAEG